VTVPQQSSDCLVHMAKAKAKPAKKAARAVHVQLDGEKWGIIREGNKRPTARFDTQKAAWAEALKMARKDRAKAVKKGKDGKVKETRDFSA